MNFSFNYGHITIAFFLILNILILIHLNLIRIEDVDLLFGTEKTKHRRYSIYLVDLINIRMWAVARIMNLKIDSKIKKNDSSASIKIPIVFQIKSFN